MLSVLESGTIVLAYQISHLQLMGSDGGIWVQPKYSAIGLASPMIPSGNLT